MSIYNWILSGDAKNGQLGLLNVESLEFVIPRGFYKIEYRQFGKDYSSQKASNPFMYEECWQFIWASNSKLHENYTHIFDRNGKCLLEADEIAIDLEGLIVVTLNGKKGLYSRDLTQLIPVEYDDVKQARCGGVFDGRPVHGYFFIYLDGLVGLYKVGKGFVLPIMFTDMYFDGKYYVFVSQNERQGAYLRDGKNIIPLDNYIECYHYGCGIFIIQKESEYACAFTTKRKLFDFTNGYFNLKIDREHYKEWIFFVKDDLKGVATRKEGVIVPPEYKTIEIHYDYGHGFYIVGYKDGEWKVVYQTKNF